MDFSLLKKTAFVCGSTQGIGKAIATALASQGATVIGTATSDNGAAAISAYLEAFGGRGLALNVTDKASVDEAIKAISSADGGIDILINNAGFGFSGLFLESSIENYEGMMNVNIYS